LWRISFEIQRCVSAILSPCVESLLDAIQRNLRIGIDDDAASVTATMRMTTMANTENDFQLYLNTLERLRERVTFLDAAARPTDSMMIKTLAQGLHPVFDVVKNLLDLNPPPNWNAALLFVKKAANTLK